MANVLQSGKVHAQVRWRLATLLKEFLDGDKVREKRVGSHGVGAATASRASCSTERSALYRAALTLK